MTIPCTQENKIDDIHSRMISLQTSFETFRLNSSLDINTLKVTSKLTGRLSGAIWGTISAIAVGLITTLIKFKV